MQIEVLLKISIWVDFICEVAGDDLDAAQFATQENRCTPGGSNPCAIDPSLSWCRTEKAAGAMPYWAVRHAPNSKEQKNDDVHPWSRAPTEHASLPHRAARYGNIPCPELPCEIKLSQSSS